MDVSKVFMWLMLVISISAKPEDDYSYNDYDDDDNGGWMEDHDSDWMQHHLLNSNCLIISGGGNKRQEHGFLIRFCFG